MKLLIVILFIFFTNLFSEEKDSKLFGYVKNPNGAILYKSTKSLKEKIILPYKSKLDILDIPHIEVKIDNNQNEYFNSYKYKGKIFYAKEYDFRVFKKKSGYSYLQDTGSKLYEYPFLDAKVLDKIPVWKDFSIISICDENISHLRTAYWYEIRYNGKVGYLLTEGLQFSKTLKENQTLIKKKFISGDGFFTLGSIEPEIFDDNFNKINSKGYLKLLKEKKYFYSEKSILKNNENFYLLNIPVSYSFIEQENLEGKKGISDIFPRTYIWLSEKFGSYISSFEYSKKTFFNSKYRKDKNIFIGLEAYLHLGINFELAKIESFFIQPNNRKVYLAKFNYKINANEEYHHNFVLFSIQNNRANIISESEGALDSSFFTDLVGDLDGDGYPELLSGETGRGSIQHLNRLYSYKKNKFLYLGNLKEYAKCKLKNRILVCESESSSKKFYDSYKLINNKIYTYGNGKWRILKN